MSFPLALSLLYLLIALGRRFECTPLHFRQRTASFEAQAGLQLLKHAGLHIILHAWNAV